MKKNSYFIWPEARYLRGGVRSLRAAKTIDVEKFLSQMYAFGIPVVVSSARSGISLSLIAQNLSRGDSVEIFPYASHCVIESIGRIANPINYSVNNKNIFTLIYHQWGYIQEREITDKRIIEDAVDSFCVPGAKLFPLNGIYEIWSLPKLVGSLGGGVVWCRDDKTANELRDLRDNCKINKNLCWFLRLISTYYKQLEPFWFSSESLNGSSPTWALADMLYGLEHWTEIAEKRKERLKIVETLLPDWLKLQKNRFPSVIPVYASEAQAEKIYEMGFLSGYRKFEKINSQGESTLFSLLPLPIHQDVPRSLLNKALKILKK